MSKIFTIGRALENDIVVNETVASRAHAQLIFDRGRGIHQRSQFFQWHFCQWEPDRRLL